jgi:hypothetical protein
MAFASAKLETKLKAIYAAMDAITDGTGNDYQAREVAKALKEFILTGQTSTVDSGATPAGSYAGKGTGTMTIDADMLESALKTTFAKESDNPTLAANIATDIDNACKADNTVSETSSGIVTTGSGATSNFSGPAIGKFSGDKSKISVPLAACFETMNGMMQGGGNDYHAAQFTSALHTYLKSGTISVTLKAPPFASGSGSGVIS